MWSFYREVSLLFSKHGCESPIHLCFNGWSTSNLCPCTVSGSYFVWYKTKGRVRPLQRIRIPQCWHHVWGLLGDPICRTTGRGPPLQKPGEERPSWTHISGRQGQVRVPSASLKWHEDRGLSSPWCLHTITTGKALLRAYRYEWFAISIKESEDWILIHLIGEHILFIQFFSWGGGEGVFSLPLVNKIYVMNYRLIVIGIGRNWFLKYIKTFCIERECWHNSVTNSNYVEMYYKVILFAKLVVHLYFLFLPRHRALKAY